MRNCMMAVLLAGLVTGGAAGATELSIFPIQGVYGLDRTGCARLSAGSNGASDPTRDTAKIHPAFCQALEIEKRAHLGDVFVRSMQEHFQGVIGQLAVGGNSGISAESRLSQVVIASLQLSRADLWTVEKANGAVDTYVPVTLTLFLSNALTGEVLFTENRSTIIEGRLEAARLHEDVGAQFPGLLEGEIQTLVQNAAGRFRPYPVQATVRDKVGDRYVVDAGRNAGLMTGDTMGADARVRYSAADYAVVEPLLGEFKIGQTIERRVAQPVESLRKPKAVVVVSRPPEGTARPYLTSLFEDAVGAKAAVAIMPINPGFASLRTRALGDAQLSSSLENERALPDYFIRLTVEELEPTRVGTNLTYAELHTYEARAFIEVADQTGRIIFATQGEGRIVDEVNHGISLPAESRRDTAIKNALIDGANKLAAGFRLQAVRLDTQPTDDGNVIVTDQGRLARGQSLLLLRDMGGVTGIKGRVWAPVGAMETGEPSEDGMAARFTDPLPPKPRRGDQVEIDTSGTATSSRLRFAQCEAQPGMPSVSNRGTVEFPMYGRIAFNSFAAGFKGAVFATGLWNDIQEQQILAQFGKKDRLALGYRDAPHMCVEPAYHIVTAGEEQSGNRIAPKVQLAVGYVLKQNDARVDSAGLQVTLTGTSVPMGTDPATRAAVLQGDLARETTTLTRKAAEQLAVPNS